MFKCSQIYCLYTLRNGYKLLHVFTHHVTAFWDCLLHQWYFPTPSTPFRFIIKSYVKMSASWYSKKIKQKTQKKKRINRIRCSVWHEDLSLIMTGGEHFAIVAEELCGICFMAPHLWFVCPSDPQDDIKSSQGSIFGCCYSLICLPLWCLNLLIWQIAGRMWSFRVGFFTPNASNPDLWLSFTGLIIGLK